MGLNVATSPPAPFDTQSTLSHRDLFGEMGVCVCVCFEVFSLDGTSKGERERVSGGVFGDCEGVGGGAPQWAGTEGLLLSPVKCRAV